MGYSEETKGYRLYAPQNKALFISRDVIFNENDAWKWDIDVDQYPQIIEEEETSSFDSPPDDFTSSESPPRKVRSLVDIYQSCDFV